MSNIILFLMIVGVIAAIAFSGATVYSRIGQVFHWITSGPRRFRLWRKNRKLEVEDLKQKKLQTKILEEELLNAQIRTGLMPKKNDK